MIKLKKLTGREITQRFIDTKDREYIEVDKLSKIVNKVNLSAIQKIDLLKKELHGDKKV